MRIRKAIAIFLVLVMVSQSLTGCLNENQATGNKPELITENVIQETFINANTSSEDSITEKFIVENLVYEDNFYELNIGENIICEAYTIELIIDENSEEIIRSKLPDDFENYDINWPRVIEKFAVGTAIIIVVGVVAHYTKGATYYFFASPAKVAIDAFVGGATYATINVIKNCKNGTLPYIALKKYSIEGFADGFMWGAIDSVKRTAIKNLKLPTSLKFADGTKAKIRPDGSVVSKAGVKLGNAYYSKSGIYLLNQAENSVEYLFNPAGIQLIGVEASLFAEMAGNMLPPNTLLQLGIGDAAKTCLTDSVGKIFQVDGELLPNNTYKLASYIYKTDALGRIAEVTFDNLTLKNHSGQLPIVNTLQEIGRGFQRTGDDRGHLIADRFGGNNTLANIVPMNSELNRGAYKVMENKWATAIESGDIVSGTIRLIYENASFRPESIEVIYKIGEELFSPLFMNL